MPVISGLSSEAEVHKTCKPCVSTDRSGCSASGTPAKRLPGRSAGLWGAKTGCEITNPFFWSLQPESSKRDSPTVPCSQKKGQARCSHTLIKDWIYRCRSSPSQHWHQRRQNTSINSSLPVTSVSRGIISHRHIHFRHAGRHERECISLWELTDSVFTGFSHTESILWMRSGAKRPSAVVSAVRPSVGP